jgi:hypothetical protein
MVLPRSGRCGEVIPEIPDAGEGQLRPAFRRQGFELGRASNS